MQRGRTLTPGPILRSVLAGGLLATALPMNAADIEAWIDTDVQDGILQAVPKVKVASPLTIRYELSAKKSGTAGTSSTRQSGARPIACCDPVSLATLRLSVGPADVYTLSLVVYVENEVAAQVEIRYPPAKDP
jgi:hypothetical protein